MVMLPRGMKAVRDASPFNSSVSGQAVGMGNGLSTAILEIMGERRWCAIKRLL